MEKQTQIQPNNKATQSTEEIIQQGDTIIIYMGIGNMKMEKIVKGGSLNLHFGFFSHDTIIGQPYGSKIKSVSKTQKDTYIYVLKPTPSIVTQTLARKTQILFSPDISAIIFKLNIQPGYIVVEAGTGSGSLSTSFSNVIGQKGKLYTFEFNKQRSQAVGQLFKSLKLQNITVTHRDVVSQGFGLETVNYQADALFLDVPNPWQAISHAKAILKLHGGRICCFSPCIEQVQKTCDQLRRKKFKNLSTIQFLARNLERRQRQFSNPVTGQQSRTINHVYSAGPKTIRGHTGYLTFAELHGA